MVTEVIRVVDWSLGGQRSDPSLNTRYPAHSQYLPLLLNRKQWILIVLTVGLY